MSEPINRSDRVIPIRGDYRHHDEPPPANLDDASKSAWNAEERRLDRALEALDDLRKQAAIQPPPPT